MYWFAMAGERMRKGAAARRVSSRRTRSAASANRKVLERRMVGGITHLRRLGRRAVGRSKAPRFASSLVCLDWEATRRTRHASTGRGRARSTRPDRRRVGGRHGRSNRPPRLARIATSPFRAIKGRRRSTLTATLAARGFCSPPTRTAGQTRCPSTAGQWERHYAGVLATMDHRFWTARQPEVRGARCTRRRSTHVLSHDVRTRAGGETSATGKRIAGG